MPLADGTYGCVQITDLQESGPGSLKNLVIGVVNWHGTTLPTGAEIAGAEIVEQGLTGIEAIGGDNSWILGNVALPAIVSGTSPFRTFEIGTKTHTYGSKNLPNTLQRVLSLG